MMMFDIETAPEQEIYAYSLQLRNQDPWFKIDHKNPRENLKKWMEQSIELPMEHIHILTR